MYGGEVMPGRWAGSGVGKYNAESPKQDRNRFNCQVRRYTLPIWVRYLSMGLRDDRDWEFGKEGVGEGRCWGEEEGVGVGRGFWRGWGLLC